MGKHTSQEAITTLKTGVVHSIQHVRSAVAAADGIEGLEHLAPAMAELETFCMIALRLMAKSLPSVVIAAMRSVEIQARIDGAAQAEDSEFKSCDTCLHVDLPHDSMPCALCAGGTLDMPVYRFWEPAP